MGKLEELEEAIALLRDRVDVLEGRKERGEISAGRSIENSERFEEIKQLLTECISVKHQVGDPFLKPSDVTKKLKMLYGYELSDSICGKYMKYLFSEHSVQRKTNLRYKLSFKDGI